MSYSATYYLEEGGETMVPKSIEAQEHFRKAIEAAEHERDQLAEELKGLEKIQERVAQLNAFIEQGKLLIGIETAQTISEPVRHLIVRTRGYPSSTSDDSQKPIFLKAAKIIRESGRSLGLSEIVEEFRKRDWKLSEDNPRQVLRNTLKSKPQMFSTTEQGKGKEVLYGLKEESSEQ